MALAGAGILTVGARAQPPAMPTPAELSASFSQLAKRLQPSVVRIIATWEQKISQEARQSPDDEQDGSQELFRRFFGPFGDQPQRPQRAHPSGSGVIIDPNGYIMTNFHVVERAQRIQVKLHDDAKLYEAKLVGADSEIDLAIIRIEAGRALPAARIGNSDAVQVGEWAIAIGAPFGLETTVTSGIISARGRDLGDPRHQLQRFLQTDAAINPGNSGGPLLNIRGEVIGINSVIATESGGYEGIGFALPINIAASAYNQIIQTGKVSRGAIGITFGRLAQPDLLKAYGVAEGVFVQTVSPGGPAEKAGIQPGDVVIALNGKPVRDGDDLVGRVAGMTPGTTAEVTVLREDKKKDFKLTIGDRAAITQAVLRRFGGGTSQEGTPDAGAPAQSAVQVDYGLWLREVPDTGIVVARVESDSFADDIGIKANDAITAINGQPVRSIADFKTIQRRLKPGEAVAFRVTRGEQGTLFLAGKAPAAK